MKIEQKPLFKRTVKKLHKNQKADLKKALQAIMNDPYIGKGKKGDLADIYVYKFKMMGQETLVAYEYEEDVLTLTFLKLGSHENFYRDLKR